MKQRSKGASAVAAAAYRACIKLTDERTGEIHDYTHKQGHVKTFTVGPYENVNDLWQAAEKSETRKNSVVARELIVPLPSEWDDKQREEFVREFAEYLRIKYGVAVQVSLHRQNNNNKNEHAHIMFTTRAVNDTGKFLDKTRELDIGRDVKDKEGNVTKGEISKLREHICEMMNRHADEYGNDWYVHAGKFNEIAGMEDHVSLKHVPFVSKDKLHEESNYDIVRQAQEYNACVVEYRKLKKESKEAEAERAQLEREIKDDLMREEEKRMEYVAVVPTVAPLVKSNLFFNPSSKDEVFISEEYRVAHEKQERLLFQKLDLERQQGEWLNQFKEKKKEEPAHEFNFIKRETRKSKERHAAWVNEINEIKRGYQECSKKIGERKTALSDETLQQNAEAYRAATAHNKIVKDEKERELNERIEQQRLEREAVENSNRVDWGAKLDESNHRSQSQTSSIGYSM